jgi:hypothetical protein
LEATSFIRHHQSQRKAKTPGIVPFSLVIDFQF